jgi:hypothetical protein
MVHYAGYERNASVGSMIYYVLVIAATFSHLISAAVFDEETFQTSQKEIPLTPALRYRRFRILQIEDHHPRQNEIVGLVGTRTSSQGKNEENESVIHSDKTFWGRLLQSDGSMSMSVPSAPTPVVKPTTAPTSSPVILPTACSSANRSDTVLGVLAEIFPDLNNATSSSPQGKALTWILDVDATDPCIDPDSIQQRYALAALFYSTSGESWFNSTGWLSKESECSWYGVSCNANDVEGFELGALPYFVFCMFLNTSNGIDFFRRQPKII